MHRKSWNTQKSKPQTYNNNNNNNNLHREPIVNTKTNSHGRSWNRESVTPLIFNAKSATAKSYWFKAGKTQTYFYIILWEKWISWLNIFKKQKQSQVGSLHSSVLAETTLKYSMNKRFRTQIALPRLAGRELAKNEVEWTATGRVSNWILTSCHWSAHGYLRTITYVSKANSHFKTIFSDT